MDRRVSINTTNISSPIAESTCLNMNGSRHGQFQWGGSPKTSPRKQRDNNISINSNVTAPNRSLTRRPQTIKIDPRTYADVQSRGLASRIVKYHDSGNRLNRSMSTGNLNRKSGGITTTHLKRNVVQYKATKQNLAMTRIAPPEQSMFYGNTLSSLLRSNSVVSLPKTDDQLSRENRPIMHPPPTESELAPTRSVLEVLKEISRKRINSDDFERNDVTKRSCNRETNVDTVDLPNPIDTGSATVGSANGYATRFKRQRESGNSGTNSNSMSVHIISQHQQQPQQQQQQQVSPEQAKKRLCNYNNDITSSYSSSKRKLRQQQQKNSSMTQHNTSDISSKSSPTEEDNIMSNRKKMYRPQMQQSRFEQISKSLSCNTPITPIPATPLTMHETHGAGHDNEHRNLNFYNPVQTSRNGSVPIKQTRSEPSVPTQSMPTVRNKPKITLFNKDYEKEESDKAEEEDQPLLDDECAGISFIKPKKANSVSSLKNPLIEKTKKSKLAMMLCGLRGELYVGGEDEDQTDASSGGNESVTSVVTKSTPTTTTSSVTATTSGTSISGIGFKLSVPAAVSAAPTPTNDKIATTTTIGSAATATSSTSFNFTAPSNTSSGSGAIIGINSIIPKQKNVDLTTKATTTTPTTVSAATKTTTTVAIPKLDGFQFQPNSISSATTVSSSSITVAAPSAMPTFSFGTTTTAATTATTTTTPTSTSLSNTASTLQFGSTAATNVETSKSSTADNTAETTAIAAQPKLGGFSLTSPAHTPATTTATTTAASVSGGFGGFQFGGTASTVAAADTKSALPAFGASTALTTTTTAAITTQVTATTTTSTSLPMFNFGSTAATATTTTPASNIAPPTLTFGVNAANSDAVGLQQPAKAGFTFGASTLGGIKTTITTSATTTAAPQPATTTTTNMFSFSGAAKPAADATKSPSSVFGASLSGDKPAFSFGATAADSGTKAATNASVGFSFVGSTSGGGGSSDGAATLQKPATAAPAFGFGTIGAGDAASSKNSITFGATTTAAAANNSTTTTTTAPVFGTNLFAFGGVKANVNATPTFGSSSTTKNSAVPAFGASAPATITTKTTAATSGTPAFSFDSNTNKNTVSSIFGAATTGATVNAPAAAAPASGAFMFGGSTTGKTLDNKNSTAAFTFSGGGANATPGAPTTSAPNNLFATGTTTTGEGNTMGGLVKPNFTFGASNNNNNKPIFGASATTGSNNNNNNTPSLFATGANNNNNNNNTFGSFAAVAAAGTTATNTNNNGNNNNTTQKTNTSPFKFGSNTLQSTPAATNVATPAAAVPSSSTSIFGVAATGKPSTFSFGSTVGPSSGTNVGATANITPTKPTFAFGSGVTASPTTGTNANSSLFAFGGSAATSTNQSTNLFSAGTTTSAPSTGAAAPAPFTFSASNPGNASGNNAVTSNPFQSPPDQRVIRRATRRLQK